MPSEPDQDRAHDSRGLGLAAAQQSPVGEVAEWQEQHPDSQEARVVGEAVRDGVDRVCDGVGEGGGRGSLRLSRGAAR